MFSGPVEQLPEEMRAASLHLHAAVQRVYRASSQVNLWAKEYELAEQERKAIEASYGEVSMRWDPNTNTMKARLDELPAPRA